VTAVALLDRLARRAGSFPGSLLLSGSSEDRLDAEARRLAALLLCPEDHQDSECDSCRRVAKATHPDLFLVEPEGVQIKVDRVREALAFAAGKPYESARRVALVLRAEQLGVEGGNALLKSLEEPGTHLHWILTTARPEALLPTIRSRCVAAMVPALAPDEAAAIWKERGSSDEDAADLALFAREGEEEPQQKLAEFRELRERAVLALEAGLAGNRTAPLLLLAEELAAAEAPLPALLAQLLADAGVAAATSVERIRHRAVAGAIGEIARRRPPEAFIRAALSAADAPPDNRRGNRRLHFEALLLELLLA
jgi:DNA polymerase III subunit delta'